MTAAALAVAAAQRQRQGGRARGDCGCGVRGVACWTCRRLLGVWSTDDILIDFH